MQVDLPVFKAWAPEWLIRAVLFLALVPTFILLALYASSTAELAGYYGVEPTDVQFSLLVYYANFVAFFPFDPRLSGYLLSRQYFVISVFVLILTVWLTTLVHDFRLFLALRFVQGIIASTVGSPLLTLIFSRLESNRARAMGYSVFYGALLVSGPLSTMLSWSVLEVYDVPALFHAFILVQLPGALLLVLILNKVRLKHRLPLKDLEWPSWLLFAALLTSLGYVTAYGEQLYWLESPQIRWALLVALVSAGGFAVRQLHVKRPYIDLRIFRYRNFCIGACLFVLFYLFRGTLGIASGYFATVLRVEAREMAVLQLATLAGTALGVSVVVRFLLLDTPVRRIWLVGFGLLLVYHVWMYFLFGPGQRPAAFLLPLFVQGLGVGTLMVPLALFTLSALPPSVGTAGSFAAVTFRYFGFIGSMLLVSVMQPYWRTAQLASLRADLLPGTSLVTARLQGAQQALQSHGLPAETAQRGAVRLLAAALDAQAQLRYCQNYYALAAAGLLALLLALLILPPLHRQVLSFRQQPL